MAAAAPPPPPPGAPKAKPDLNAVYRPFEDEALTAHITESCKEPELPQQQAVSEMLELLAGGAGGGGNETNGAAAEPETAQAPLPDLLGLGEPAAASAPADLLDLQPAASPAPVVETTDLLGNAVPVVSVPAAPAASADLLGESPPVAASVPQAPAVDAVDVSAREFDLLLGLGSSSAATDSSQAVTAIAEPGNLSSMQAVAETGALAEDAPDDFDKLLAASDPTSCRARAETAPAGICRLRSEEDVDRVVDMEKMSKAVRAVPATLDLSGPTPGEDDKARQAEKEEEGPHLLHRVKEVVGTVMPSSSVMCGAETGGGEGKVKTEGFGSEDLYPNSKPRSLTTEAAEAWGKVVDKLPDNVKQYMPEPLVRNQAPEAAVSSRANEVQPPTNASASKPPSVSLAAGHAVAQSGGGLQMDREPSPALQPGTKLEAGHQAATINRACEGKWVPTYMRQQLAAGGHTELPRGVNAHEYPADRPPPSVSSAFREMGEEVQESAQAMLTYVIAFLSTMALQCQMCSQNAATTVHESTVDFGASDDAMWGSIPDEASLGLGPMRSRVQRKLQGVSLERLLDIAKTKLATHCNLVQVSGAVHQLPAAFQRIVKAREFQRQAVDRSGDTESWFIRTEASTESIPQDALQLLGLAGFPGEMSFRERWQIQRKEAKATVDLSNEHLESIEVVIAIRMDIVDRPDLPGCEVDSRLYAKPRAHGAVMPLGLVERLTQLHHMHSESLRDAVMNLAEDGHSLAGAFPPPAVTVVQESSPEPAATMPPVVNLGMQWPAAPEKRPCNTEESTRLNEKLQAHGGKVELDKSVLLQVADGI